MSTIDYFSNNVHVHIVLIAETKILTIWCFFKSGIGLRETIQSRLSDGGAYDDCLAGRMAAHMLDSKAKATHKYFWSL